MTPWQLLMSGTILSTAWGTGNKTRVMTLIGTVIRVKGSMSMMAHIEITHWELILVKLLKTVCVLAAAKI